MGYRLLALLGLLVFTPGDLLAQDGLSLEHYERLFPHPPTAVKAEIKDGHAAISWRPPSPPPAGKIGYDPVVAEYRVYRLGTDFQRRLVGKTEALGFQDPEALSSGATARYGVTAVQRNGVESALSNEAAVRAPVGR